MWPVGRAHPLLTNIRLVKRLQRLLINLIPFLKINRAAGVAFETGVKEA
jgi:hypothetical protein